MKLIIAGGRDFTNYALLDKAARYVLKGFKPSEVTIISGTARGADQLGEQFAANTGCTLDRHPADWNQYGKRAGYLRNEEMARIGSCLIACWDGQSRGTKHMIDLAKRHGLDLHIVWY